MDVKLETVSEPRQELVLDHQKIAEEGARRAVELLRRRVAEEGHVQTGAFVESYAAELTADGATVAPRGQRNQIIAKVFAQRGVDLVTLTDAEQAEVALAMRDELERQMVAGVARID